MPIYKVDRQGRDPRVVEAPNPAAARRHVANDEFAVSILSAKDAFALSNKGTKLETAGEEPENLGNEGKGLGDGDKSVGD